MRKRRKRDLERAEWIARIEARPKLKMALEYIAYLTWRRKGRGRNRRKRGPSWQYCLWIAFRADFEAYRHHGRSIFSPNNKPLWIKGRICPIPAWPEKEGS